MTPLPADVLIDAAANADWQQVVLNHGPPCFHYEPERKRFCLRAQRWEGHGIYHAHVTLADLLRTARAEALESAAKICEERAANLQKLASEGLITRQHMANASRDCADLIRRALASDPPGGG